MNLTSRAGRRLAAGLALACCALFLPAAALAASPASGSPAHPAAAAVPPCVKAGQGGAFAWLGQPGDGFAGGVGYPLEISNTGRRACTLRGSPQVVAVTGGGRQVGMSGGGGTAGPLVTLQPGATAHAILLVHIPTCAHPVTARVVVYLPGQTAAQPAYLSGQFCRHEAQLGIDAIHPGTGIPFYTIR